MSEPTAPADDVDEASARFWRTPTLGELMGGVEPLRADESFAIPDLTDHEWAEFTRALHE